ncbi:apolipoprotein N-acyltransferase [Ferrimonas gelatinilytica]|uniref:Apolipoprotein N-acyltransferase n=1 Tax=Ferrimonas gelatinilytica TaxID=1255257 RepID=A0ABP9RTH4_9GAMM
MNPKHRPLAGLSSPAFHYLLALLSGILAHLAFAPYPLWPLLPLSLALLLWQTRGKSAATAGRLGWAWGFGLFAAGIRWVHVSIDTFGGMPLGVSLALMALLCLYLAIYPALALYLLNRFFSHSLLSRTLAFPALWLVAEWLRGKMLTGFPWLWSGYSQLDGPMASLAPVIGALGLGMAVSFLAAGLAALAQGRWRYGMIPLCLVLLSVLATWAPRPQQDGRTLDVALVQGNIAQSLKWEPENLWPTLTRYQDMSRPHFDADLIIWPEAAVPAPEVMVKDFLVMLDAALKEADTPLISGIISMDPDKNFYNSLLTLGEWQQVPLLPTDPGRYHKHQLLPIGEFVPMEDLLRPLAPFFNLPMSSFARGDFLQPNLSAAGVTLAPAICYEIAFPELVRSNVHADTDLLLTVSNDAWFGDSIGPHQHMAIARMRSLELGRPLLRVTNNGITAVVDERGQITAQLPQFEQGVLRTDVSLVQGQTWFNRLGQDPLYALAVLLLVLSAWAGRRARD